jgi:hypothetical protein
MPILAASDCTERIEEVRRAVVAQIQERNSRFPDKKPVFPWTLVTAAYSYLYELPAKSLRQIRLHADTINGTLAAYYYLNFPQIDGEGAVESNGYTFLAEGAPMNVWAREYDIPGMPDLRLGYEYKGLTICDITVPRQQNVCNLYRLLQASPALPGRRVFVEIGAGYGSFALDATQALGDCAYVIVDLPETILYSAIYLGIHRPDARIYLYAPGDDIAAELAKIDAYDLAFVPNYQATALECLPHVDVGFNAVSFPEMGQSNTREYVSLIAPKLRRFFMSINHCYFRQDDADPLIGVNDILAERMNVFPQLRDYREQLGISDANLHDISFWPTLVGFTDQCVPISGVELRCVSRVFDKGVKITASSLSKPAVLERWPKRNASPSSPTAPSGIRGALARLLGG